MATSRRVFDKEFKLQVLRELQTGSSIAELARHGPCGEFTPYTGRSPQRTVAVKILYSPYHHRTFGIGDRTFHISIVAGR
jgi:hypothetical protein